MLAMHIWWYDDVGTLKVLITGTARISRASPLYLRLRGQVDGKQNRLSGYRNMHILDFSIQYSALLKVKPSLRNLLYSNRTTRHAIYVSPFSWVLYSGSRKEILSSEKNRFSQKLYRISEK